MLIINLFIFKLVSKVLTRGKGDSSLLHSKRKMSTLDEVPLSHSPNPPNGKKKDYKESCSDLCLWSTSSIQVTLTVCDFLAERRK